MKNKLIVSTLSFAFAAASFAADLTVNGSALSTDGWDWTDSANWTPAGSTVEGSNLNISGALDAANSSVIGSEFNANNVIIDLNTANKFTITNNVGTASFENLTIENGTIDFKTDSKKLSVNGTMTVRSLGNVKFTTGMNENRTDIGKLVLQNDRNKGTLSFAGQVEIGVLEMRAVNGADGASVIFYMHEEFLGGLSDGGVKANHKFATSWSGPLHFKNTDSYSWSGEMALGRVKLSMEGSGEQRLDVTKFSASKWEASDGVSADYIGKSGLIATVSKGRLIINETSQQHCSLTMSGGLFKTESGISFIDGNFTGGGISVGNNSGTISFERVAKNSANQIVLDFAELTQVGDYNIISVSDVDGSTGFEWSRNDVVVKNLKEGLLASLGWKDGTFTASITSAVPEPATVAAILGVFALAFAAYRRRR